MVEGIMPMVKTVLFLFVGSKIMLVLCYHTAASDLNPGASMDQIFMKMSNFFFLGYH